MNTIPPPLLALYRQQFDRTPDTITPLQKSGSDRQYFRLQSDEQSVLGVFNNNQAENQAYIGMTHHFQQYQLPVPNILRADIANQVYLVQDLGDQPLLGLLSQNRSTNEVSPAALDQYKQALSQLARLQITAGQTLDNSLCWQRKHFDRQSILWDLNYFKYYFLKLLNTPFDEQGLENDFHQLADFLLEADAQYFMFRDFQARNIMIFEDRPYFIDFQGGRRGALQYDVVSLLYQAKANLPNEIREELLQHYLNAANEITPINAVTFRKYYVGFQVVRFLQVLGAYGFRGIFERKAHFLSSIPFGIDNLKWWLQNQELPIELKELIPALHRMLQSEKLKDLL